jgi:uncharacterized protein YciI
MTSEIPPGAAVETIYVVEATYGPDAAEARRPVRAEHLARVLEMRRSGILLEAGGFLDFTSALLLFRTASAEEALQICRDDVYTRSGVWVELRVRPWGRVVLAEELPATAS